MTVKRLAAAAALLFVSITAAAVEGGRAADAAVPAPVQTVLTSAKRCLGVPWPTRTVVALTQAQDWCDPNNLNRLQADVFVKLSNGGKGAYLASITGIDCVAHATLIHASVRTNLC